MSNYEFKSVTTKNKSVRNVFWYESTISFKHKFREKDWKIYNYTLKINKEKDDYYKITMIWEVVRTGKKVKRETIVSKRKIGEIESLRTHMFNMGNKKHHNNKIEFDEFYKEVIDSNNKLFITKIND